MSFGTLRILNDLLRARAAKGSAVRLARISLKAEGAVAARLS